MSAFDFRSKILLPALFIVALLVVSVILWLGYPHASHLFVRSDPPGALILLDLQEQELRTPSQLELNSANTYSVQVKLPGFVCDPLLVRHKAHPGQTDTLFFSLIPVVQVDSTRLQKIQRVANPAPVEIVTGHKQLQQRPTDTSNKKIREETKIAVVLNTDRQGRTEQNPTQQTIPLEFLRPRLNFENWNPQFYLSRNSLALAVEDTGDVLQCPTGPARYKVTLAQHVLLDTLLTIENPGATIQLHLPGPDSFISVTANLKNAELLLGDNSAGRGAVLLPRSLLPLVMRFGKVENWLAPAPIMLVDTQYAAKVSYTPVNSWSWPAGDSVLRLVESGVYFPESGFQATGSAAGETLRLGRARNDRRPWGSTEFHFSCELPQETHVGMPATLVVAARDTENNFPMSFRNRALLWVEFNGVALTRELELDADLQERSWPISRYLHPGVNTVRIRAVAASTSWAEVRTVKLELGP